MNERRAVEYAMFYVNKIKYNIILEGSKYTRKERVRLDCKKIEHEKKLWQGLEHSLNSL